MSTLYTCRIFMAALVGAGFLVDRGSAQFVNDWSSIDGGGIMFSTDGQPGGFELSGTIGQPDAGVMTGGTFELTGGFWAIAAPSGTGVPAATLTGAALRKPNTAGPGGVCDLPVDIAAGGAISSEPRAGGITQLRIAFDVAPGAGGADPVTIEQDASCPSPPTYAAYSGSAVVSAAVAGNELVLTFSPALENARTYRMTLGSGVTSIAGQSVEVRGLLGDVDNSGRTNGADRSFVVSVWTSPANFSCATDLDNSGRTNGADRSFAVSSWTGGANCAP